MTKRRQQKVSKKEPERGLTPISLLVEEAPLSPYRAFVVQFREETGAVVEHFAGRVEHMTSGHATRFRSPEELLAFLTHALNDINTSDSSDE